MFLLSKIVGLPTHTVNPVRHIWHKLVLAAARSRRKCHKTECEANLAHVRRTLCAGWGHTWGIYASCVFVMAHMRHICFMWACDGTHVAYLPHVCLWWYTWGIFASCVLVMVYMRHICLICAWDCTHEAWRTYKRSPRQNVSSTKRLLYKTSSYKTSIRTTSP
jgi:hypothetical protein